MKKYALMLGALSLGLTTCVGPAAADTEPVHSSYRIIGPSPTLLSLAEAAEKKKNVQAVIAENAAVALAERLERQQQLDHNVAQITSMLDKLQSRVGRTYYVFSGSQPSGWDCSGLVRWAYGELGIDLEHRASKQQFAGTSVESPLPGDIVVFTYNNKKSAYHTGIYLSDDTMIHAGGGKGDATEAVSISKFAGEHSQVTFRRLLETTP